MHLFEEKLSDGTVELFCIYHFKNFFPRKPEHVLWKEYLSAVSTIKRISKKISVAYLKGSSVRYIMNHMLNVSQNFNDVDAFGRIMFFYVPRENHSALFTLLWLIEKSPVFCPEADTSRLHLEEEVIREWKILTRV
jgi:hypothetical protein